MKSLIDIKYDWLQSEYFKEKQMSKWAEDYIKNNTIDFANLKVELNNLILKDNLIGLNSFNRYGVFDMQFSSLPNAILNELIKASKNR